LEFGSYLIVVDIAALAEEMTNAYATRTILPVPLSCESVAEGSGRNSLRSPALCLGELASATLTDAPLIAPGETWTATLEGIDLGDLTLRATD
jgi:hypothetical protein